jgi:cell division protease FtsH
MHTRDYSDETARVIDEEVERILRDEEDRCRKVLTEYRAGLDAVAKALRERETLSGLEVADIVDNAMGRKVGGPRVITKADGTEEPAPPIVPPPYIDVSNADATNGIGQEAIAPAEPRHGAGS